MSSLKVHTIQSIAGSAVLFPFIGENVIAFGLACILIDTDHVIEYVRDTKSFQVMGVFPYSKLIETNPDKNFLVLDVFHTVEFLILIFLLGLVYPVFMYVLAGLLFHIALDLVYILRYGNPFCRAYSVIEYLIRKRNPKNITSIYQLIKSEDLATEGIKDIDKWVEKWLMSRTSRESFSVN